MTTRGSTAPALLQDLLQYNPRPAQGGLAQTKCQHDYTANHSASVLPELDERAASDTRWSISCVCQDCRCHLDLSIDFHNSLAPCPNSDFPLHHFLLVKKSEVDPDETRFQCSASECHAVLSTRIRLPVLSAQDVFLLTDTDAVERRLKKSAELHEDIPEQKPINTLKTFSSYIRDSLQADSNKKVPAQNKRFMLSLGDDAADLLIRLGFTYVGPANDTNLAYWYLPKPVNAAGEVSDIELKTLLEDTKDELAILMRQRPEAERRSVGEWSQRGPSSKRALERILGMQDCRYYNKSSFARSSIISKQTCACL